MCAKAFPPDVGGVQTYSEYVARAYLKAGVTPVVVSRFDAPIGWHTLSYPEGELRLWNAGNGSQAVLFLRMLRANAKVLARERVDFVHPTTWRPAASVAPWRGKIPMVLSVHGQEVLSTPAYLEPVMRGMLSSADVVVAVSRPTLAAAEGALAGRSRRGSWLAAHNGLSYEPHAREFQPVWNEGPVCIYTFARLAERKNVQGSLRALRMLVDRGVTNFRYLIGGNGPMRKDLEALAAALGLSSQVEFLGYVAEEDIPGRYKAADIFLHPQTAPQGGKDLEGFGLAIADSMSFGAVAVVGSAGGPADFVTDDVNGLVVDGEDVSAIAGALERLLVDGAVRRRLSAAGRAWVLENLSWDRHAGKILGAVEATRSRG